MGHVPHGAVRELRDLIGAQRKGFLMNDPADREVFDPTTMPARLAEIAAARPDLATLIARHPNAYPELIAWAQQVQAAQTSAPNVAAAEPDAVEPDAGPESTVAPAAARSSWRRILRTKGVVIGASVAVGALVLGGGAFAAVKIITSGASSPEAAAQRLIDGTLGGDLLALAGTFAPSESKYLSPLIEKSSRLQSPGDEQADYVRMVSQLKDSATITTEGFEYETEELAHGVQRVSLVDGKITIDGDPAKIADALAALAYSSPQAVADNRGELDAKGVQEQTDRLAEQIADQLPIIWDIGEFTKDLDVNYHDRDHQTPLSVVVVDEGGWYVSPLMSFAELYYSQVLEPASRYSDRRLPVERGDEILEGKSAKSPEAALSAVAEGIGDAYATGDVEALAAALPLPERRLVSIYGPAMFSDSAYWSSQGQERRLEFPRLDVKAQEVDGGVQLTAKKIDAEYFALREASGSVQFTKDCVLPEWSSRFCLSDQPVLGRLGLTSFHVIATQEDGGWVINPLATLADQGRTMLDNYADYLKDDELDKLFATD